MNDPGENRARSDPEPGMKFEISASSIKNDLFGGVTAAVVALPLALAFGVSSGAGALAGLYAAVFAGFMAAVFGGTRVQITGPTGPMTVVMALVITHFSGQLATAFAVVVLAGIFQLVLGKLGIGRFIKLVPQPVISGFMTGIGVIIIVVQFGPILGQETPAGGILEKLEQLPGMLSGDLNPTAIALSSIVLAILIWVPSRLARLVPPALFVLLAGTLATILLSLPVPVIGPIPTGLPDLIIPSIDVAEIPYIVRFALVLAFLGSIDSLLTSIVADSLTRSSHDSNRELVGQGLGNIAAGLFGGLPSAGATMRTLVNLRAGGRTRLSGVVHSVILAAIVLGFGHHVSLIPLPVLAAILVKVGLDIIDWQYLRLVHILPRAELAIMLVTLLLTVLVDLITAVATGFVMASVMFVAQMAKSQIKGARFVFGADDIADLSSEESALLERGRGCLVLFHVEGPLSFASARDLARLIQSDVEKDVLAIDMRDVPFIDSSACVAIAEVIERLHEDGDSVVLFGLRDPVGDLLRKSGALDDLDQGRIVATRIEAMELAVSIIDDNRVSTRE